MQLVLCALLLLPIALACNPPPTPLLDCAAPAKLCGGLRRIQQASCEQLQSEPFVVSVVLQMGLARHPRNESLYGPGMGKYMAPTRQGGLGQQPVQIASALMFLSKQQISTYVEVGFCQGWTLGLISTYLQRFAPGGKVRAIGVDVQFNNLAKSAHTVLESIGVSVQQRLPGKTHARSMVAPTEPTLDLCFIDAAHNYGKGVNHGVVHDYVEFAPYCKIAMFHDVVDYDVGKAFEDGGVSRFWADLKANTPSERVVEFIQQPGVYPSTLGIGIVIPQDRSLHRQPAVPYPWRVNSTAPWMYTHTSMKIDAPPALNEESYQPKQVAKQFASKNKVGKQLAASPNEAKSERKGLFG